MTVKVSFLLTLLVGVSLAKDYIRFHPKQGQGYKPYEPPKWPSKYSISGTLNLPYAELSEPFTAWFDADMKSSRIDYYGGLSKTIQRGDIGDYGQHFMISPMTNEVVMNQQTCFTLNGTKDAVVGPQAILPDASKFQYKGKKSWNNMEVDVWELIDAHGVKVNRYTLYLDHITLHPVYYEMLGYNSLLGSHFDEYKLYYTIFTEDFPTDVFNIPADMKCQGFPGPGEEARIIANPMKEFIYPEDHSHLHKMYSDFINEYKKKDIGEEKKHTFKHNLRYINSMNRKNLSYRLKVNHFADHSPSELRRLRGRQTRKTDSRSKQNKGKPFLSKVNVKDLPAEMNWRLRGAVTPVKDQAVCGSCWSFGSTGAIEGAVFVKTGHLVRLSSQNLMDCSWGFGNNGCDGGEEFRAYEWIMKHGGIATELSYGQYLAVDSFCHTEKAEIGAQLSGYVNVTSGSIDSLKEAIATKGPCAVGIDAAHLSFVFYANGVYYEPECGNKADDLDHAVLAVGYGTLDGQAYWLVKNSWSTHWGNDGYVLMSQKDNNCGVATDATFVELK